MFWSVLLFSTVLGLHVTDMDHDAWITALEEMDQKMVG